MKILIMIIIVLFTIILVIYRAGRKRISSILIIGLLIYGCTSCVTPRTYGMYGAYERAYGTCPAYPEVKHYRMHSKRINPRYCNFIN